MTSILSGRLVRIKPTPNLGWFNFWLASKVNFMSYLTAEWLSNCDNSFSYSARCSFALLARATAALAEEPFPFFAVVMNLWVFVALQLSHFTLAEVADV